MRQFICRRGETKMIAFTQHAAWVLPKTGALNNVKSCRTPGTNEFLICFLKLRKTAMS